MHKSTFFQRLCFVLFFLFGFFITPALSQNPDLRFKSIFDEIDFPSGAVNFIHEDFQGFLWFGTHAGLVRYDGYTCKQYSHDEIDTTSISGNEIISIHEDELHNFWIGTTFDGLNYFDRRTGKFTRFQHAPDDPTSLSSNNIYFTHLDRFRFLWIAYADSLLDKLDTKTRHVEKLRNDPGNPHSFSSKSVNKWGKNWSNRIAFCEDDDGDIWIGTKDAGVNRYDRENGRFIRYQHRENDSTSVSSNDANYIFKDDKNEIWITTSDRGLNRYIRETDTFKRYQKKSNDLNSISSDTCGFLYQDGCNRLWISHNSSLDALNMQTGKFAHYVHSPQNNLSISPGFHHPFYYAQDGAVWSFSSVQIFDRFFPDQEKTFHYFADPLNPRAMNNVTLKTFLVDFSGLWWLGDHFNGAAILDPFTQNYQNLKHIPESETSLFSNRICSILQSKSDTSIVWVGSAGALHRFDKRTQIFKRLKIDAGNNINPLRRRFFVIYEDSDGFIWTSYLGGGLLKLDDQGNVLERYRHDPIDARSICADAMEQIVEAPNGNLWIGTNGRGLDYFDKRTKTFTHFTHNPDDSSSLGQNFITILYYDKNNQLWVGNERGLDRWEEDTKTFTHFLPQVTPLDIYEDTFGKLWVGTRDNGLMILDRETGVVTPISVMLDLPKKYFASQLMQDDEGFLWFATFAGIIRIDPQNYSYHDFSSLGILPRFYFDRIGCKLSNGEFWFSTLQDGILAFHPRNIKLNTIPPKMVFTDIKLFDESLTIGKESPLAQDITLTKEIHFQHWQNDISIETAAIHYVNPKMNRYRFRLENYDEHWRDSGTNRVATYTNLDQGEYIFHAKGANGHGFWNEEPISLRIVIHPPWWATAWAYGFYFLLFGGIVVTTWKLQARRVRLRHDLEKREFEAEQLKKMDHLKSQFFANISHEFRTPITLIKGPLDKLFAIVKDKEAQKDISIMRRNINRLHQLINQLLDLSALESGKMELNPSTQDVVRLVRHFVQSFESQAKLKGVELSFDSDKAILYANVDKNKMEDIIYNLVSNALKFTKKGGEVQVHVSTCRQSQGNGHWFEIRVSDTGIGIPTDRLERIFDRFYQVDDSYVREAEGSGIGLSLTRELIELHGGEIVVNSAPGVGSVFTVRLPAGKIDVNEIVKETGEPEAVVDEFAVIADDEAPVSKSKGKPIVLIVEDNADLRTYIRDVLRTGYQFKEAADGQSGFELAQKMMPDLIISDVMMPKMDGFQLCAKLKADEITSHIPIILLTARASKESKLEGLETGADDYLIKPFDADELNVRIKNLIAQRKRLQERFAQKLSVEPKDIAVTSADEQFMRRALDVLETHMADAEFNAETFAAKLAVSRSMLHRKLRGLTGQSTTEFIRCIRLKRAAQLIKQKSDTISQIAYQVGFNHLSYFADCFKKQFGVNPKEFR